MRGIERQAEKERGKEGAVPFQFRVLQGGEEWREKG